MRKLCRLRQKIKVQTTNRSEMKTTENKWSKSVVPSLNPTSSSRMTWTKSYHSCHFLSLNGETSQQNEKTYTSYSKMSNANDSSMNGICNTYAVFSSKDINAKKYYDKFFLFQITKSSENKNSTLISYNLRIIQEYFQTKLGRKNKNIQPGPEKQHSY